MSEHKLHFGAETAAILGEQIMSVYPVFDLDGYVNEVAVEVEGLELKDRVMKMTLALQKRLPQDYPTAVQILVNSLGDEIAGGEGMFTEGWYLMPVARFVEEFGLDHWEVSMQALNAITRRHTAEYAVRPYIEQYPLETMALLCEWAHSANFHVRRLVSEGTRPRLPWASQLRDFVKDPTPVLRLLEVLRNDDVSFVQKSVANNLNDITKDHPDLVLKTVERWLQESPTANTRWIVKHALRTLEKENDPRALALLGYTGGKHIELVNFDLSTPEVKIGDAISFDVEIRNTDNRPHMLTLNYSVHLVRKNGARNLKVFKLGTQEITAHGTQTFVKSQSFKPISIRNYYPGTHQIDIVVNGLVKGSAEFELLPA